MAIARIDFTVLGTVGFTVDGDPIPPGTRKERMLLALLLVNLNQTVSTDEIVDVLWGDEPPAKPGASVRAYVANLRRSLAVAGGDPKQILTTGSGGYRLVVDRSAVDACRLDDAVALVARSDHGLDGRARAAVLDDALESLSGEPFADFAFDDFAAVETARLGELVLTARELRCDLAIELGESAEWLPTISALSAMHPWRERFHAALMRALAASGRHGEALRVFAAHRTRSIEEMGVEPGPTLRAVEREVLALDSVGAGTSESGLDEQRSAPTVPERRRITSVAIVRRVGVETELADARRRWAAVLEAHGATIEEISDGVVAHIGYPIAQERDVERAVRAALAVAATDPDCAAGVATGDVLATPGPGGVTIAGEAPATAIGLAGDAPMGSVAVSDITRRLVTTYIRFEQRGDVAIAVSVEVVPARTDRPALVGREEELALAGRLADEARGGTGRVIVVTGEAGIGKTALIDRVAADFGTRCLRFRGSPFHVDTALWPVAVALDEYPGLAVPDVLADWVRSGEDAIAQIAADPSERRSILLDATLEAIVEHASGGPTMCVFDDVHVMDASTRELLGALADTALTSPLFVVVAARSSESMGFVDTGVATTVGLGPLSEIAARSIIHDVGQAALPAYLEEIIVERAGGVPLFVEELSRALAETRVADHLGEPPVVPDSISDLLAARLDSVPGARATLQVAAVVGDGFTADLLAALVDDGSRAVEDLAALCEAGVLVRRRGRPEHEYRFRHGLILEAAYASVPDPRRIDVHRRVVARLEDRGTDGVDTDAELLARHSEAAGELPGAVRAWLRAARRNLAVSALPEASGAIDRGLAVADRLDADAGAEVVGTVADLWLARGVVATQREGPSSRAAIAVFDHLLEELADSLDSAQRFRARWGRWFAISTGWRIGEALAAANEVYRAAVDSGDTALLIEGHHVMWATCLTAGEFERAREHIREAKLLYEPAAHHWLTYEFGGHDPGVCMHSIAGLTNWMLDDGEDAREELAAATRLGDELGHAYSRLEASFGPVTVAVLEGDVEFLLAEAEALERLVDRGMLPSAAGGYVDACRGVAAVARGAVGEGRSMLRAASGAWAELWGAYCLPFDSEYAAALAAGDRNDEARAHIDVIFDREARGPWWDSELRRVYGTVLALSGDRHGAVLEMRRAAEVARSQGAVALERRIQRSLEAVADGSKR